MRHNIIFFVIVFALSGCGSMETIKKDYLTDNELNNDNYREIMDTFKRDYIGIEPKDTTLMTKAKIMAYEEIIKTKYKDNFEIYAPEIDTKGGMPEALPYIFVHFSKRVDKTDIPLTTYLVVVDRFYERIAYSGVYELPQGDLFYRYQDVLRKIKK